MVSWWGTGSYFNTEQIQIDNIDIINYEYSSSGSFGSIVRSKHVGHNTYTGRRSNFHSKTTPINGPVYKYYLNYSYSKSHFSRLPQVVAKKLIYNLSQKCSYSYKIFDLVINGFSQNNE